MMCKVCNSKLSVNAKFCTNCGHPVAAMGVSENVNNASNIAQYNVDRSSIAQPRTVPPHSQRPPYSAQNARNYPPRAPQAMELRGSHVSYNMGPQGMPVMPMHPNSSAAFAKKPNKTGRNIAIILSILFIIIFGIIVLNWWINRDIITEVDFNKPGIQLSDEQALVAERIDKLERAINSGDFNLIESNFDKDSQYSGGIKDFLKNFNPDNFSEDKLKEFFNSDKFKDIFGEDGLGKYLDDLDEKSKDFLDKFFDDGSGDRKDGKDSKQSTNKSSDKNLTEESNNESSESSERQDKAQKSTSEGSQAKESETSASETKPSETTEVINTSISKILAENVRTNDKRSSIEYEKRGPHYYEEKLKKFKLDLEHIHELNGLIEIDITIKTIKITNSEEAEVMVDYTLKLKDESMGVNPIHKKAELKLLIAKDKDWYINAPVGFKISDVFSAFT